LPHAAIQALVHSDGGVSRRLERIGSGRLKALEGAERGRWSTQTMSAPNSCARSISWANNSKATYCPFSIEIIVRISGKTGHWTLASASGLSEKAKGKSIQQTCESQRRMPGLPCHFARRAAWYPETQNRQALPIKWKETGSPQHMRQANRMKWFAFADSISACLIGNIWRTCFEFLFATVFRVREMCPCCSSCQWAGWWLYSASIRIVWESHQASSPFQNGPDFEGASCH